MFYDDIGQLNVTQTELQTGENSPKESFCYFTYVLTVLSTDISAVRSKILLNTESISSLSH